MYLNRHLRHIYTVNVITLNKNNSCFFTALSENTALDRDSFVKCFLSKLTLINCYKLDFVRVIKLLFIIIIKLLTNIIN